MKPSINPSVQLGLTAACFSLLFATFFSGLSVPATAQAVQKEPAGETKNPPQSSNTNAPSKAAQPESSSRQAGSTNASDPKATQATDKSVVTTDSVQPGMDPRNTSSSDDIQLSFQGANVDMIVQWLAQTTGKSVVKHPQVQCQLTIVSSKKISRREAINLVYRALSLEGFTAVETSNSILVVPEGKEPKMSAELVGASRGEIPEGRQRLLKVFSLKHVQAADLKEKIRGVLSDKATIDTDDRANQIIVTDYNDNLRLLEKLVGELDVASGSDSVVRIYSLKHADAEELGNLLSLVINAQAATSSGSQGRSSSPPGGGPHPASSGPATVVGGPQPPPSAPPATSGGGPQQVRIWPDKTSNRLIVAAPESKLPEIENLIEALDTDKPQGVAIRVIPLKNVNAQELVKEIAPLYQKMNGKSLKDTVEVAADDRANSLIVLSSESNYTAIEKLISTLDTEDAQDKIMQAFPLKNADAQDVAKQLKDLAEDTGSSSRYPFYFFSSAPASSSKKMNVVADRRRNTVIVQAPPTRMEGIAKMIEALDEPVSDDSLAPKIYPLKYVSAADMEDILNELFLKKQQMRPYWYYYDESPESTPDRDVGRLYGKVRITSEPHSNTLIVTANSKENLAAVEEVLKQLDAPSEAGESTLRVGLKFAKAFTVANSINILFAKNGSPPLRPVAQPGQPGAPAPQQQSSQSSSSRSGFDLEQETKEEGYYPWLGGQPDNLRTSEGRTAARPVSDLVGRVRAVADLRSNALLVSANVHFFPQVLKLIEDLDAPTDQVVIEARLVEVSSDFLDKLGVRWSPDGSKVFTADDFDNSLLARANSQYQKGFGGRTTVNTPGSSSLPSVLASLRSGVLDSTISMDYLVQFLRKTTAATVLAEPQINIRDNETGRLFVGQQVPIPDNTQVSQLGGQNTSIKYKDVGVVLEVTPHINTSGDVELKIHAESSTVVPGQTVLGGALFDTRNFRTDLRAKDGQTLVLGGIIQKQVSDTLRKTPILGSIPVVGWAFKKKDKTTHEVELMVFLRPKVVRNPQEAQELLEEIERKAPLIKKWNDEAQPNKEQGKRRRTPEE